MGFISRTIRPDILFLIETMVNEHHAYLIIRNLGFSYYERIPAENHYGRIWCLWNLLNVNVTIMATESKAIHCHVMDKINNKQCLLTTIYAPCRPRDKDVF